VKEYFGTSAKKYGQTRGKRLLLFSAIKKHLPRAFGKKAKLLDIGCGNGDVFSIANAKGYQYFGLDISPDILDRAKTDYPTGTYCKGNATDVAKLFKGVSFDAVIVSMLFPSMEKMSDITKVLEGAKKLLKKNATMIVAVTHPCFDHYMQSFLFQRTDVKADFHGYFNSGSKFEIEQTINSKPFVFEDYHWTLTNYIKVINDADLHLIRIDECAGTPNTSSKEEKEWAAKRDNFPTYIVFVLKNY